MSKVNNKLSPSNIITDHLDTWTQAIETKSSVGRGSSNKFTLVGIKKLRELILEMAVRGLLVPQDPSDEPAIVLLEKIAAEKAQLIKDGKIKKTKAFPEISEDEKPFLLPYGWGWARLNDIYDVRDGTHDSPKAQPSGYPLVTSKNLSSGRLDLTDIKFITEEAHLKIQERSKVDLGDVLFAMIGSIGNPVIVDIEDDFSIKNVALFKYYNSELSSPDFLRLFLEFASVEMKEKAAGGVQSFVSLTFLRSFVIPEPPLAEQKRIVAKVDELMALCDQLEQQTLNSIEAHQTLVETLLNELVNPNNTANIEQTWSLVAENFDVLFTTEKSIDTLKQTILQLAVMGKLVPQNPNDEPASKLLEKIATEKAQLIKDKKIKKTKPLPEITEEEKPFELPYGWEWVRWESLLAYDDFAFKRGPFGSALKKSMFVSSGYKVYEQYCPINDDPYYERYYVSAEKFEEMKGFAVKENDYLVSCSGVTLGRITQVPEDFKEGIINQALLRVRINHKYVDKDFFKLIFRSPYFQKIIFANSTGSAIPNLKGVKDLKVMLLPFLTTGEQRKIVNKFEEVMTLCDQLKTQLQTAQQTQINLAQSIAQETLK